MKLEDEKVIVSYSVKLKNKIKVRDEAEKEKVSKSQIVDKLIEESKNGIR